MGSLVEELRRREAAALAEASRLRGLIEELSGDLARAEEQASRLAIALEEVTRVLEGPVVPVPDGDPVAVPQSAAPVGALLVPQWHERCRSPTRTCSRWPPTRGRPSRRPRPAQGPGVADRSRLAEGPGQAASARLWPLLPLCRRLHQQSPRFAPLARRRAGPADAPA